MNKFLLTCILFLSFSMGIFAQGKVQVTGIVKDNTGEPLIGVNISVKNVPGLGSITDIDGKYKISVEQYNRLVFTYIGHDPVEVLIKEQLVVDVTMKESSNTILDEVVVTGTGHQQKVSVTGAITTVDVERLKSNPTGSISNALAGNVPGILAMQSSGKPGSISEFWIRGISTFGASNSALVLVDGFERTIDEVNIEDIADFVVLKDASATAIYGSRGANGVILITTKRGHAGKIVISGKANVGYNMLTSVPDFVDGNQYARLMNEARITRNQEPMLRPDELDILQMGLDPDLYPNINWKDVLLKDAAMSYRASLNMEGGGETARYFVSGSYEDQGGMYKTDKYLRDYNTNANYKKYNYRLSTDIDVTATTLLKVGVSGSLQKYNDTGLGTDALWGSIIGYNPIATPLMYSNGYVPAYSTGGGTNPWVLATMTGYRENWKNNIQTNITLEQNFDFITQGLSFVGRLGYDTENDNWIDRKKWPEQWKAERFRDIEGNIVFNRISEKGEMQQDSGSNGRRHEFFEWEFHYNRGFGAHHIGGTVKYNQSSKIQTVNIGNDLKRGIANRNQGIAGRTTYRWHHRYFAEFNFGYTGSENFASGHQFGFFPAVSGGWNIADEPFVKNSVDWVDMFKIRYSWGRVGNDQLGDRFPYLYDIVTDGHYQFADYGFNKPWNIKRFGAVASPYVTWEISTKNNLGLDVSLFHDKFSATVDFFHDKREGIFMARDFLPSMVGLESAPKANVGKVTSKGFDGNLAYRQKVGNVDLTLRSNITYSKNEVLDRDEENRVYSYLMQKGHRIDQARGLIALGLFEDYDDIRNSPRQDFGTDVMPGDIKYKDVNGDGVINGDDEVAIGATMRPNLIYGVGASAHWNGLDINLHFQGAGKSSFFINGPAVHMFAERDWGNIYKDIANSDRWISAAISGDPATENPNASYPRLSYGGNSNNYRNSTFWMKDGSYLRLKTVDVGYTIPKHLTNMFHIDHLRVFFVGTNLLTWSSFKMWDPEQGSSNGATYPLAKTLSFGLNITL